MKNETSLPPTYDDCIAESFSAPPPWDKEYMVKTGDTPPPAYDECSNTVSETYSPQKTSTKEIIWWICACLTPFVLASVIGTVLAGIIYLVCCTDLLLNAGMLTILVTIGIIILSFAAMAFRLILSELGCQTSIHRVVNHSRTPEDITRAQHHKLEDAVAKMPQNQKQLQAEIKNSLATEQVTATASQIEAIIAERPDSCDLSLAEADYTKTQTATIISK